MSSIPNASFVAPPPAGPPVITQSMLESLRQTKPWVRFLSILGLIGTGLLILVGLFLALGAGVLGSMGNSPFGGVPLALIGLVYAVMGLIYLAPALFLFRYAAGIQKALKADIVLGFEYALRNQKSFWKFVGILMLIVLLIQVAVLLLVVVVGIAGLAGLRGLQG